MILATGAKLPILPSLGTACLDLRSRDKGEDEEEHCEAEEEEGEGESMALRACGYRILLSCQKLEGEWIG